MERFTNLDEIKEFVWNQHDEVLGQMQRVIAKELADRKLPENNPTEFPLSK